MLNVLEWFDIFYYSPSSICVAFENLCLCLNNFYIRFLLNLVNEPSSSLISFLRKKAASAANDREKKGRSTKTKREKGQIGAISVPVPVSPPPARRKRARGSPN